MSQHEVMLRGCTPEPLISYLKALGILRLVSLQADSGARSAWRNDTFLLRSSLDENALVNFFLNRYEPTPVLSPWNAGCGFYKKWNPEVNAFKSREAADAIEALTSSTAPRFESYRAQIYRAKAALVAQAKSIDPAAGLAAIDLKASSEGWSAQKRKKERDTFLGSTMLFEHEGAILNLGKAEKDEFLAAIRSSVVGNATLQWLDTAFVLLEGEKKNRREAPLLGSGGNVGNSDFSAMFAQMLAKVLSLKADGSPPKGSEQLLESALFDAAVPAVPEASVGQFFPGEAGGPNMTQGVEGTPILNPWEFVLMVEGSVLFAGAASKRFGMQKSSVAFPFSVGSSAAGYDSASESKTRGEIWLPVWVRSASLAELEYVFREGRSDVSRNPARDGVTFARAVASLGVERGIHSFTRFQFQARLGDNYIATALGRFRVREQEFVDLLREADSWLGSYRMACGEKAPRRFVTTLRNVDRAIFDYCRYGGAALFQSILVALGAVERELAGGESFRIDRKNDRVRVRPLKGLSPAWIEATGDQTAECEIALALASIFDAFNKIGPLRANLEPFDWENSTWAKARRSVVWQSAHLNANLAAVLERRVLDGTRAQCPRLPLAFNASASLDAVAQFLAGDVDDERIDSLLWAFLPVEIPERPMQRRDKRVAAPLPRAYALLKLCFLPYPIEIDGERYEISPEPAILSLLQSNRLKEACDIALRRFRVSGLSPLGESGIRTARRDTAAAFSEGCLVSGQRLAASLLIPISAYAVGALCRTVLRIESPEEETNNLAFKP